MLIDASVITGIICNFRTNLRTASQKILQTRELITEHFEENQPKIAAMKRINRTIKTITAATSGFRFVGIGIILQLSALTSGLAQANTDIDGILDESPSLSNAREPGKSAKQAEKDLRKEVRAEERELAKLNRNQLKQKADKGERLAQVKLGSDFASEAQLLTFAPAAANDALSDALRWYSAAAKRGFPGALSLDTSGVSFYPVRVVRNQ